MRIALLGENDPLTAQSRIDYALCLLWDSKVSQAEQQVEKALDVLGTDADNVDLVWAHRVLTGVYTEYGEYDRALFEAEMAWRKAETSMGAEHPLAALMHVYFAQATLGAGRLNAANRESQMALERMLEIRSETHVDVALAKRVRAMVLRYYGKLDEAISFAQQALEVHLELLGESDPVVQDYVALSQMHRQSRRWEEAETLARKAVDVAEKNSVQQQSQRILAYQNLAAVLAPKKPHDSLEMLDTAIAMKRNLVGNRPDLARLLVRQGRARKRQGRAAEAVTSFREAMQIIESASIEDLRRDARQGSDAETLEAVYFAIASHLVEALIDADQLRGAEQVAEAARVHAEHVEFPTAEALINILEAKVHLGRDEFDLSLESIDAALVHLEAARRLQAVRNQALLIKAKCLVHTQRYVEAEEILLPLFRRANRASAMMGLMIRPVGEELIGLYRAWRKPARAAAWERRLARFDPDAE